LPEQGSVLLHESVWKCGRVLDNSGVGNAIFTNQALAAALDDDTDIINLSLGSTQRSKEQEKLVWKLYRQGVLVVAAAGNRGSSEPLFPGAFDGVLTVGALDHKEARASFSNYGAALEIVAPGVACYGPYLGTSFRKLQGTSMAAPVVTGIMALALSYLKASKPEMSKIDRRNKVMEALKISAKDLGPAGWDQEYGFGGLDALALFRILEN
jgi:subtilisin family serine protease